VGQFFEPLGFTVLDKWYVLSEFHSSEESITKSRMGGIKGKPTEENPQQIRRRQKTGFYTLRTILKQLFQK